VLLTHAHIDHYGALAGLDRAGAPLFTSAGTARQVEAWDSINHARFGMTVPSGRYRPDRTIGSGEKFTVDGDLAASGNADPKRDASILGWHIEAFDFLITTSANVLAAELIVEKQKHVFEESLKVAMLNVNGEGGEVQWAR
jgi:mRNA degradation ribonuclease J1/J2